MYVGQCIYCGNKESRLTDEHVIPVGLLPHGEPGWVLRKASCQHCSKITSAFERAVLRGLWEPVRTGLHLRSYRKRKDAKTFSLTFVRDSKIQEVFMPIGEYPATMQLLEFAPPAYLDGRPYKGGIDVTGHLIVQVAGPNLDEVVRKLGAKSISFKATFENDTYERLLLKVAYGYAVARLGLGGFEQVYILPALFGQANDIGRWLGCDGQKHLNPAFFHSAGIAIVGGEVLCRVRLFSSFETPEYLVVVGKAAKGVTVN